MEPNFDKLNNHLKKAIEDGENTFAPLSPEEEQTLDAIQSDSEAMLAAAEDMGIICNEEIF